jgi:hypothetical protein
MLADVDPGLGPLYEGCKRNRDNWEKLQQEHDKLSEFFSSNLSVINVFLLFFELCSLKKNKTFAIFLSLSFITLAFILYSRIIMV